MAFSSVPTAMIQKRRATKTRLHRRKRENGRKRRTAEEEGHGGETMCTDKYKTTLRGKMLLSHSGVQMDLGAAFQSEGGDSKWEKKMGLFEWNKAVSGENCCRCLLT